MFFGDSNSYSVFCFVFVLQQLWHTNFICLFLSFFLLASSEISDEDWGILTGSHLYCEAFDLPLYTHPLLVPWDHLKQDGRLREENLRIPGPPNPHTRVKIEVIQDTERPSEIIQIFFRYSGRSSSPGLRLTQNTWEWMLNWLIACLELSRSAVPASCVCLGEEDAVPGSRGCPASEGLGCTVHELPRSWHLCFGTHMSPAHHLFFSKSLIFHSSSFYSSLLVFHRDNLAPLSLPPPLSKLVIWSPTTPLLCFEWHNHGEKQTMGIRDTISEPKHCFCLPLQGEGSGGNQENGFCLPLHSLGWRLGQWESPREESFYSHSKRQQQFQTEIRIQLV